MSEDIFAPPRRHVPGRIRLYDEQAFAAMRIAGRLTAHCLDAICDLVRAGVTTEEIHDFVLQFSRDHGAIPASLNYRGYLKSCCTSLNHVVCHGIPGKRRLKEGDIVNIDVTLIKNGWHGDASRMYVVGTPRRVAVRLIDVTYESLLRGIAAARPGATTGHIGAAIQDYVEAQRFSVVRDFCGHGIGEQFHDLPNIPHFGRPGEGYPLQKGMIFTIEPMINSGRAETKMLSDGWTAVTRDRSLSAQFEHTIGIGENGAEIFTASPRGLDHPYAALRQ